MDEAQLRFQSCYQPAWNPNKSGHSGYLGGLFANQDTVPLVMRNSTHILLVASYCLSGCAAPVVVLDYYDMESDALSKIRGMTILEEQAMSTGDFTDLGVVKGFSCEKNKATDPRADTPEAKRNAVDQVKLRAAAKGAKHISTPQCDINEHLDLTNNCWTTIACKSHALKAASP